MSRLEDLGVPGLEGDTTDGKVKDRVRRIMGILEAAMNESAVR